MFAGFRPVIHQEPQRFGHIRLGHAPIQQPYPDDPIFLKY